MRDSRMCDWFGVCHLAVGRCRGWCFTDYSVALPRSVRKADIIVAINYIIYIIVIPRTLYIVAMCRGGVEGSRT